MKQAKAILLKHLAGEEIGGDNFDNVILAMDEYAALRLGEYVIREVMEKFKADLNASELKNLSELIELKRSTKQL